MFGENDSYLEISIDTIPINVAVYRYEDGDFIFVDFNSMAEKTDNVSKDKLIGKHLTEVFPKAKEFGFFDVLLRVYKNGGTEELDLKFYEDERIKGWRKNRVSKLKNGNLIAFYNDLTVQKETEHQLQSLGYIVDNSNVEVYIFDINSFNFTYINKAAEKNIGYTLQEMKSMTPVDIKPQYNMQSFKKLMKHIIDGSEDSLMFETVHQRKDSSLYNSEIRIKVMSVDNKKQFVVFANDISKRKKAELQLQESEEQFRAIAENSSMGIFIYQDKIVYVNQALEDISEYSQKELFLMEPWENVQEEYIEKLKNISKRRLKGENFPQEYNDIKVVTKSGKNKIVRVSTQTIRYKSEYAGLGTVMDITDIVETKQQLKLLGQAVEQMDELVRITDKEGAITYVNEALVAHTGYMRTELIGEKINIFKSDKHDEKFYKNLWDTISSGNTFRDVFINKKKDKQLFYEEETITPIMNDNNEIQNFVATSHDITERVKMEIELNKLATIDSLTSIYNRHKISEELDIEIARANRYENEFSIIMLDIDHFKDVNDIYGHDIGDSVLIVLCEVISKLIRESDRFGRWGGEEFIIISPNIDSQSVVQFAHKIKDAISRHIFKDIEQITISAGVTSFHKDDTKESILKRVDKLLYKSKNDGRNKISFE